MNERLIYIIRRGVISALAVVCLFCIASCQSTKSPVEELKEFRTEVKENCGDYTVEQWEHALQRFSEICQKIDNMELTREERREIISVKGEVVGYAATCAAQQLSDEFQIIADDAAVFLNALQNTFQLPLNDK